MRADCQHRVPSFSSSVKERKMGGREKEKPKKVKRDESRWKDKNARVTRGLANVYLKEEYDV